MKKQLLFSTLFLFLAIATFTQNNLQLQINHKLGSEDFAMEAMATNNMENTYFFTRLQYYISQISIIHDGGTETLIEDTWILVNAAYETTVDLGDHEIETVEAIHFHIGVEEAVNHEDPAAWPAGHPLAPVFPSMHWGWTAGYRFAAIEGMAGANVDQLFQFHGLEDDNYFKTEIALTATAVDNQIVLELDADYQRTLGNIDVDGGNIVHGGFGDAKKTLENFRDYVFSASGVTSTVDYSEVNAIRLFPNPTATGQTTFQVESTENLVYQVKVCDLLGRTVQYLPEVPANQAVNLTASEPGMYWVSLIKEGSPVLTKKLVVE